MAKFSNDTSIGFQQTTLSYIPEHRTLDNHCRENVAVPTAASEYPRIFYRDFRVPFGGEFKCGFIK
jgi:hypothetical protein